MPIDVDKLREDLKNDLYGAFFGGGYGGALVESFDIDKMSDEEVINEAIKNNVNLSKYTVNYY